MMGWRKVRGGREREKESVGICPSHRAPVYQHEQMVELVGTRMAQAHPQEVTNTWHSHFHLSSLFSPPFPDTAPLAPHSLSTSSAHSTARPHLSVQEEAPIVRGWVQQWWMMEEMNKWPSDLLHVSGAYCHCANSQRGDHPQLLWAFQINPWTHKCVSLCKGRAGGFSRTHAYCRL